MIGLSALRGILCSLPRRKDRHAMLCHVSRRLGISRSLGMPSTLWIEPSNLCNLRCLSCPTGQHRDIGRKKTNMELSEFKKLVDEGGPYAKILVLYHQGEPFLNPHFNDMVRYASQFDLFIKTSTNSHFFTDRDKVRDLIDAGIDELLVCMDGFSQESMERYRVGCDFERVRASLRILSEEKQRAGGNRPIVELQMVIMKHNQHEVERIKAVAKELKFERFSAKLFTVFSPEEARNELIREMAPDNAPSRFRIAEDGTVETIGSFPNECGRVYKEMVICADGTVVSCNCDWVAKNKMGNALETSIREVWNGPAFRAFRRQIKKDRSQIQTCNFCSELRFDSSIKSRLNGETERR